MMGAGAIPKENWVVGNGSISHMTVAYHLGPNVVLLIGGSGLSYSQFWPGSSVGSCTASIHSLTHKLPTSDQGVSTTALLWC